MSRHRWTHGPRQRALGDRLGAALLGFAAGAAVATAITLWLVGR